MQAVWMMYFDARVGTLIGDGADEETPPLTWLKCRGRSATRLLRRLLPSWAGCRWRPT